MKRGARRDDGMGDIHEVTIGFLGCGNIGNGVWRLINEMAPGDRTQGKGTAARKAHAGAQYEQGAPQCAT